MDVRNAAQAGTAGGMEMETVYLFRGKDRGQGTQPDFAGRPS